MDKTSEATRYKLIFDKRLRTHASKPQMKNFWYKEMRSFRKKFFESTSWSQTYLKPLSTINFGQLGKRTVNFLRKPLKNISRITYIAIECPSIDCSIKNTFTVEYNLKIKAHYGKEIKVAFMHPNKGIKILRFIQNYCVPVSRDVHCDCRCNIVTKCRVTVESYCSHKNCA